MTQEELKGHIYRNSISNYIFLVVRLGLGVVLFRMLFNGLSGEEFGFWALLWSVFGYGILLDFGFGFTAQKRVAELSTRKDWHQLSQVLSTIFFSYVGIAALLIVIGLTCSPFIVDLFAGISPENKKPFTLTLTLFFCGMGLAFPLGMFPEMLKGQQRISLANYTLLAGFLANFVLVILCIKNNWGLHILLLITVGCSMVAEVFCGIFALRAMPEVKIRPSLFSRGMVHNTMRFSIFAYVTTLTTVILTRTDQLVLSTMLAVSAVALYQASAKVSEMFSSFAMQIPETLSPAAAHLHAKGDNDFLRRLLIDGTRFSVMLATPLYLLCAFFLEQLLWILTGQSSNAQTFWTGQVLLFWVYTTILTQSVSKRIFMMCGHERRLMWLGVGEALLNLALSIALLAYYRNVVSVAVGSLVATFVFGWFALWPWAAREANLSGWKLACTVIFPTWLACLPIVGIIIMGRVLMKPEFQASIYALITEGTLIFMVAAVCLYRVALSKGEREKFIAAVNKIFRRPTVA
ncbi:MAG: lipopolysaccharide biosynthesis protein [Limisphaerales bacterium]